MMEEAEKILRQAGCPKINLQIRSTNTQVIEFYRSLGFKVDEVTSMGKRLEAGRVSLLIRYFRRQTLASATLH